MEVEVAQIDQPGIAVAAIAAFPAVDAAVARAGPRFKAAGQSRWVVVVANTNAIKHHGFTTIDHLRRTARYHFGAAAAHSQRARRAWRVTGARTDHVKAGFQQRQFSLWQQHSRGVPRFHRANTHDHGALRQPGDDRKIVELFEINIGATSQPELQAANVKLGAATVTNPQVVAGCYREIAGNGMPVLALVGELYITCVLTKSGDATWRIGGGPLQLNLGVTYNGEQYDTDFGTFLRTAQDPYTLIRLGASYRVNDSIEIYGRIENLTDETYEEVIGYLGQPQGVFFGVRFRDDKAK